MKYLFAFCLLLSSPAFAQGADVVYNLPSWGASLLTFALALTLFTQAVKTRLKSRLETVPHYLIHGTTFAVGLALAALIQSQGLLVDPLFSQLPPPFNWLLYGGLAGVGSTGGYDLLRSLVGLAGGNTELPKDAPTPEQAEAQVSAVPKLAIEGGLALAAKLGVPGFVAAVLLNENTFDEAERLIREMGKKRALTEDETKADQDAWEKAHPVVVKKPEPAKGEL